MCRHTDVASATTASQLVWKALDSAIFDKVVGGAKTAVAAYAAKKITEAVGSIPGLMGRNGKGRAKRIALVEKMSGPRVHPGKGAVVLQPLGSRGNANRTARAMGLSRNKGGRARTRFVSAPVAKARVSTTRAPKVGGRGPVVVAHSEYIAEVSGSVGFVVSNYAINPGLASSFPWLTNIAAQYEEYRVKKLHYRFETEAPTSKAGTVILVTDVDALDTSFQSKQQAMDYRGATRTAPWQRCVHDAQAAARSPYGARFVRSGLPPSGGDLKTYDVGSFQLITQGMNDTSIVGELYVDYIFEFIGPKVNNILGQNLLGGDVRSGGVVTPGAPLGSAPSQVSGSNIQVAVNNNSMTFSFTGRLLMTFSIIGTGISAISITPAGGASTAVTYTTVITATAATTTVSMDLVNTSGQGITLNVTATTVTSSSIVFQQMSSGLLLKKESRREAKSLPTWTPPDPLQEKIARLEEVLARVRLAEERSMPPSSAFRGDTGLTGF